MLVSELSLALLHRLDDEPREVLDLPRSAPLADRAFSITARALSVAVADGTSLGVGERLSCRSVALHDAAAPVIPRR